MIKRILKKFSQNFCIYLLVALNLIHALQENSYDWLLWISLLLALLAVFLDIFSVAKEDHNSA